MKKNLLWMLAAWMLAMVTVSCSSDDNYVEEPMWPRLENGKVVMGSGASRAEIAYVPANMDELPEWLQKLILADGSQLVGYILCEGTWDGQHAYFFWHGFSSLLAGFYTYEGVQLASYLGKPNDPEFIEKGGGWDNWTCLAFHYPIGEADEGEESEE